MQTFKSIFRITIYMKIRTLVKSGPSSFVVSLPKEWVDKKKLKQGDNIYVEENIDGDLKISSVQKKPISKKEKIIINIDGKNMFTVQREILEAYVNSHKYIRIQGKTFAKNVSEIKKIVENLVALEIVDEDKDMIELRDFLSLEDATISGVMRRMDNIARSMLTDLPDSIQNPEVADGIIQRDVNINRLIYLAQKLIKAAMNDDSILTALALKKTEIVSYWELGMQLEKIGDEFKRIAKISAHVKKDFDIKTLKTILAKIKDIYCQTMNAHYKNDKLLADSIYLLRTEMNTELDEYLKKNHTFEVGEICGKLKGALSHMSDISRLTEYINP